MYATFWISISTKFIYFSAKKTLLLKMITVLVIISIFDDTKYY